MRTSVAIALFVAACVDKGPGPQPKKIDPGFVGKHLLAQPPELTAKLDVVLGGRGEPDPLHSGLGGRGEPDPLHSGLGGTVVYLGNTVESPRIVPGGAVKITHYWKVVTPPGPGWTTFSLFRGAAGLPDFMALPETDMSVAHGPATWRAGEIIEDPQEITLRPDWRSPTATLSVGLIASGAHGVDDRMAAQGANVVDRAVVARVFDVDLSKAPPPPGTIYVPYARGPIVLDGLPADIGWTGAITSPELVTGEGSPEPVGKAIAKMTWDDKFLYLFVTITDNDVFSEFKKHDDPLWKEDCVEVFIDADGNKRGYVELQVNPNNATFDSWFAQGRAAKGDEAWDSAMTTAVVMHGTADKGGDTDQGWDVEIAIPWMAIKGRDQGMSVIIPPRVGDRWKLNVVRVDKKTGDKDPAVSSWNRITYADFHALDRMLTVVFADPNGGVTPGTPVGAAAAGSGSATDQGTGAGSGSAAPPTPTSSGAQPIVEMAIRPANRNTATISINAKGEHTINGAVVKEVDLETVLRSLYARDKNLEIAVVLQPGVAREKAARVLDVAKSVGITKVAVQPVPPPTR